MTLPVVADGCADLLRTLGDDTRLAVVRLLMAGPLHVGEIKDRVGVEQTLLSHHLRTLREGGIVQAERDGKAVLYRLMPSLQARRKGNVIDLGCCRLSFE